MFERFKMDSEDFYPEGSDSCFDYIESAPTHACQVIEESAIGGAPSQTAACGGRKQDGTSMLEAPHIFETCCYVAACMRACRL